MDFEVVIIGAGVVGLAIAAELSKTKKDIVIVEKNAKFGQETSSRNSEVIHSGIYYPANTFKAKFCLQGRKMLYEYCKKNEILHKKCGKYIVATNVEEKSTLNEILINAQKNGVQGIKISGEQLKIKEPNVYAVVAIYFPESGIIDTYGLMKTLERDALNNSTEIAYNSEVTEIKKKDKGYLVSVKENNSTFSFTSKIVINAAGLLADKVSEMVGINNNNYKLHYWKGEYFSVGNGKNKLINSLIYPVPNAQVSLGIHATIDLNGGLKLGPNATFIQNKETNYNVNKNNLNKFYSSAKKYLPFLNTTDLRADQSGIRPKLTSKTNEFKDFVITNEKSKGYHNFLNLIGIESPGLTACLAIAKYVNSIIDFE